MTESFFHNAKSAFVYYDLLWRILRVLGHSKENVEVGSY